MRRFFVATRDSKARSLTLEEGEAFHAARVLRMQPGEMLLALNGVGDQFTCRVVSVKKSRVELEVVEREYRHPLPGRVTLVQSLPRGKLMEDIVQKATELGVCRIVPLLSQRTEVKLTTAHEAAAKVEKWNTTAREACKQCGGLWLPQIEPPQNMQAWIARRKEANLESDLSFVASLETETRPQYAWFEDFQNRNGKRPQSIELWIGPEGDFTPEEYACLRQNGVLPITLGPLVLRCETAAISAIAIALSELSR